VGTALGTHYPDEVNIVRQEDNRKIKQTAKNGKYYYFANLLPGTYQIDTANGTSKRWPLGPGSIDVTNVKLSKTDNEKKTAFDVLKHDYKDSLWVNRL